MWSEVKTGWMKLTAICSIPATIYRGGFHNWACFSAQQSADKAIKAVFQSMGAEAWGHSVADLLRELAKNQHDPEKLQDAALELDKAYIPTRYPNAQSSGSPRSRYTKGEARRLIGHAERILRSVRIFYPKFDKEERTQRLKEKIEGLKRQLPAFLIMLFGSYAYGSYTVASDVDLLVVYRGKTKQEAFAIVKKALGVPLLEPHVYSKDEYERLRKVITEMTARGVVLCP